MEEIGEDGHMTPRVLIGHGHSRDAICHSLSLSIFKAGIHSSYIQNRLKFSFKMSRTKSEIRISILRHLLKMILK